MKFYVTHEWINSQGLPDGDTTGEGHLRRFLRQEKSILSGELKRKATVTEAKEQGGSVVHRRTHGTMKNPSEMEELAPGSLIQGVM